MTHLIKPHSNQLENLVQQFGSPLNVVSTDPLVRNISELNQVATNHEIDFQVFFARKANKCLAFVDAADSVGAGIDVASGPECQQVLDRGVAGRNIICTAAIKTESLIELCIQNSITIALDNYDELHQVLSAADRLKTKAMVALRISGFRHQGEHLHSRFGFDIEQVSELRNRLLRCSSTDQLDLVGLHFHLDGYCAHQRVSAIQQCLPLIHSLRSEGHPIRFLDIGGGIPMSYLDDAEQWNQFWTAHEQSVLEKCPPITYRNHGLGLQNLDGRIRGRRNLYPFFQSLVRADWMTKVLKSTAESGNTIAEDLRASSIQLRCEPGRSLLDGCGMTVARVEYTKCHRSGDHFIGLAMNRTQCRTSSDDFLVDPLVIHRSPHASPKPKKQQGIRGYLVGAYCTESELISLRRLHFPNGIGVGDLVVIPNTAGYFMHFLESRSHQFPLAKNVVFSRDERFQLDRIDQ